MASWTDRDKDVLRTMWALGASSRDISEVLEFPSRNAVMGMVNRLGLMGLGHADERRMAAIANVEALMGGFDLGEPLHAEALATFLLLEGVPRVEGELAAASGVARERLGPLLERVGDIWPIDGYPPRAWAEEDGSIAFILDLAFLSGGIERPVVRGPVLREAA